MLRRALSHVTAASRDQRPYAHERRSAYPRRKTVPNRVAFMSVVLRLGEGSMTLWSAACHSAGWPGPIPSRFGGASCSIARGRR